MQSWPDASEGGPTLRHCLGAASLCLMSQAGDRKEEGRTGQTKARNESHEMTIIATMLYQHACSAKPKVVSSPLGSKQVQHFGFARQHCTFAV